MQNSWVTFLFELNTDHAIGVTRINNQIAKETERNDADVRVSAHAREQRSDDDFAGQPAVAMNDACRAVSAFAGQRERIAMLFKIGAPREQLFDLVRTFFDEHSYSGGIA